MAFGLGSATTHWLTTPPVGATFHGLTLFSCQPAHKPKLRRSNPSKHIWKVLSPVASSVTFPCDKVSWQKPIVLGTWSHTRPRAHKPASLHAALEHHITLRSGGQLLSSRQVGSPFNPIHKKPQPVETLEASHTHRHLDSLMHASAHLACINKILSALIGP